VNAPEKRRTDVLTIDGVDRFGPLPPNSGDLRATYGAWIAAGNKPAEYEQPGPGPDIIYKAPMFRGMTDAE
jgi:hypothetical protein